LYFFFNIFGFEQSVSLFFKTLEENQKEDIDLEIESLLEESPKYSIVAKIFERSSEWAYAYDTEGIGQFEFDDGCFV
jgi:hypothetical protein